MDYISILEYCVENNVVLSEGLLAKLKQRHEKKQKEKEEKALQKSLDNVKKRNESIMNMAKKWWKEPYYIDNMAGEFRILLTQFAIAGIPESQVEAKLVNNANNFNLVDIIDNTIGDYGNYNKRILSVLDKNRKGYTFSGNDDDEEFISPINKKLYAFYTDGTFEPIHLYKFFIDDMDDVNYERSNMDEDDIKYLRKDLGIE